MAQQSENSGQSAPQTHAPAGGFELWSRANQTDFEIDFYERLTRRDRCYVDAMRVLAERLTERKFYRRGLQIDQRLVQLLPNDAVARYNLACSYALVNSRQKAIKTLRQAIELGYDDFEFLRSDSDLDNIRHEPEFQHLLREHRPRRRRRRNT